MQYLYFTDQSTPTPQFSNKSPVTTKPIILNVEVKTTDLSRCATFN